MAFFFAQVFQELGGDPTDPDFIGSIETMAYTFMVLGAVALVVMTIQNTLLELAVSDMTQSLKTSWFDALLRQDMVYYDMKDVSGTATMISVKASKYKRCVNGRNGSCAPNLLRHDSDICSVSFLFCCLNILHWFCFYSGMGRKLGEGVQFTLTMIGGFAYAFYASWRTSLIVLAAIPLMAAAGIFTMKVTQGQTARSNAGYAEAGSVAYETVSGIKTVFSLNAVRQQISKYNAAVDKSFHVAASYQPIVGCALGSMMASYIFSYVLLTLYGSYLLYSAVRSTGCDPSGILTTNETCDVTAAEVFGALMGMTFGAVGLPQISAAIEALQGARSACYPAIAAMRRSVKNEEEMEPGKKKKLKSTALRESMLLPKYVIDSSSPDGMKPRVVKGDIEFSNVSFKYPTRKDNLVFDGLSLNIEGGKTVALVGPSGSGKSTVVQLLERFYDPSAGSIRLDGTDLRELNVKWLRENIGLVSQEPVLFARSIKENISYGFPQASQEQIENACISANAHDFIMKFPQGYDTEVGDKGAQLSGGQVSNCILSQNPVDTIVCDEYP